MTMTTTLNLLEGMALVETWDGKWFPAFAPKAAMPHSVQLLEDAETPIIPPALDPLDDPRRGYACREAAIQAWYAWHEAAVLPVHWQLVATHIEVYPERNAWYLHEIAGLTGDERPLLSCGTDVYAVVIATGNGGGKIITATGNTPDEAIEALYQGVYEWSCQYQASGRAS